MVPESIIRHEIVFRGLRHHLLHNRIYFSVIRVGKKHRLDIGVLIPNVNHAILLLLSARKLMFLYLAAQIILKIAAHHQPILRTPIHSLRIHIVVLLRILFQPAALLPKLKILYRLIVRLLRMLIYHRRKINLGTRDMKQ